MRVRHVQRRARSSTSYTPALSLSLPLIRTNYTSNTRDPEQVYIHTLYCTQTLLLHILCARVCAPRLIERIAIERAVTAHFYSPREKERVSPVYTYTALQPPVSLSRVYSRLYARALLQKCTGVRREAGT